jgi:hypothetical protein
MTTIILGKRPQNFKRTVNFVQVDGTPGSIEVTFKYRTRTEFGAFADGVVDSMKAEAEAQLEAVRELAAAGKPIPELTQGAIIDRDLARDAKYVAGCVEGWNLGVALSKNAIVQLADEVPAAIGAIALMYREASIEGRLGN